MKKIYSFISLLCIFILSSCSDEVPELQTRSGNNNPYAVYFENAASKPELSLLEISLGTKSVDDLQNYNIVFTEKDAERIYEMSSEELVELKKSRMQAYGVSTEEEMEKIIDESYEKFCADMDEDDLRKLNAFGEQYLALPAGYASFSKVYPYEMNGKLTVLDQKYLQYAIAIDNYARPLYNQFVFLTRSPSECQKYLLIRLAITSVSYCYGCLFPGGWLWGLYGAFYDAMDAAINYKTCLRTRTGD
ncbi:MAG: hypothetical protein HDR84_03800 [Bacteroides sp.]|nr:hypothetical protein [Bacteroides sp.]